MTPKRQRNTISEVVGAERKVIGEIAVDNAEVALGDRYRKLKRVNLIESNWMPLMKSAGPVSPTNMGKLVKDRPCYST